MEKSLIRKIYERICRQLRKKRILYVGTAEYSDDVKILEQYNQVISIDKAIRSSNFGAKKHYVADITEALKFQDSYFDVIMMFGVHNFGLNHQEDVLKAFNNLKRVLKVNGSLFVNLTKIK